MSGFKSVLSWCVLFATTGVVGTAVVVQQRKWNELAATRDELAAVRQVATRVAMTGASSGSPPSSSAVAQPHDAADRVAIHRLQSEIDQLRERITARERALREVRAAPHVAPRPRGSITDEIIPCSDWTNAGRETPVAAIETALWAGAGGDLRAFDELLAFDEDATASARALFDRLPVDIRAEYEHPGRFIALLTAADVPLTAARVVFAQAISAEKHLIVAQLSRPNQPPRLVQFQTRADSADGGWRIVVPRSAIDGYAAKLSGEPLATATELR